MKPSDADARAAIQALIAYLDREWIVEECESEGLGPVEGCWSCRAVSLRSELRKFDTEIADIWGLQS